MKLNPVAVTIALLGTTVLGFFLLLRQCSTTRTVKAERDTLSVHHQSLRLRYDALRDTNNLLVRLVYSQGQTISKGKVEAAQAREKIQSAVAEKKAAIAGMNDAQVKLAALRLAFKNGDISEARLRDSLSVLPIFTEAQANRKYLELVEERNMWRDSTQAVYEQLGQLKEENSELENELNGVYTGIADNRSFVQAERAKAKGIFARKRNKVLGEVDARDQRLQARRKVRRP